MSIRSDRNVLKERSLIKIWSDIAPGSEELDFREEVIERSDEPEKIKDRAVLKIISPSLTVYKPEKPNGASILVIPGGAYQRVVIDKEGDDLYPWLNSSGITYFVLRYRLPGDGHKNFCDVPLQDAQRALRVIRNNAKAWGLDKDKIGAMGFSAGGHLASSLAVKYAQKVYEPLDAVDKESARPDFLILGYPVITMKDHTHQTSRSELLGDDPSENLIESYSNEMLVSEDTPKTFLIHASDDSSVPVENSIAFYSALRKADVPAELHIFLSGGHGFGVREIKGKPVEQWTILCSKWLKEIGILNDE